jgi:hypothetical protein
MQQSLVQLSVLHATNQHGHRNLSCPSLADWQDMMHRRPTPRPSCELIHVRSFLCPVELNGCMSLAGALVEGLELLLSSQGVSYGDAITRLAQELKSGLVSSSSLVSGAACQLACSITGRAQPALLRHLLQLDMAEYLLEVVRGSTSAIRQHQQQPGSSSQQPSQQQMPAGGSTPQDRVQALAVQSLGHLSYQPEDFVGHAVYGLATLTVLLGRASEAGDGPLLAGTLQLLERIIAATSSAAAEGGQQQGASSYRPAKASPTDMRRLAAAVVAVLPDTAGSAPSSEAAAAAMLPEQDFRPTPDALASYCSACSILKHMIACSLEHHPLDPELWCSLLLGLQRAAQSCGIMSTCSLQQGFLEAGAQLVQCGVLQLAAGWLRAGALTDADQMHQQCATLLQLLHDHMLPALARGQQDHQGSGLLPGAQQVLGSIAAILGAALQLREAGREPAGAGISQALWGPCQELCARLAGGRWIRGCLETLDQRGSKAAASARSELHATTWRCLLMLGAVLGAEGEAAAAGTQQLQQLEGLVQQASRVLRSADDVLQLLMDPAAAAGSGSAPGLVLAQSLAALQQRLLGLMGLAHRHGDQILEPAVLLECIGRAAQGLCASVSGMRGGGMQAQQQRHLTGAQQQQAQAQQPSPSQQAEEAAVMLLQLYAEVEDSLQRKSSSSSAFQQQEASTAATSPHPAVLQLVQLLPAELVLTSEALLSLAISHSSSDDEQAALLHQLLSVWLERWQPAGSDQLLGSCGSQQPAAAPGANADQQEALGLARLLPGSFLGPGLPWMAQQLAKQAAGVLAVQQLLQALQAQPESPLLAKGLVLLARMVASNQEVAQQLATEQDVSGLTGRLLLACSNQLQQPGPASDVALLSVHLLEVLVTSAPPDVFAELALPASRQVAKVLDKLWCTSIGVMQPQQGALLLQCVGAANALLFRALALQLEPGLLEPLFSSAAAADWLLDTLAVSSWGRADIAAAPEPEDDAFVAPGSSSQRIISTPAPAFMVRLVAALSLVHLWLMAQAAGAPGSSQAEVVLHRRALEASALIASSNAAGGAAKALALKCACTSILAMAAVAQQRGAADVTGGADFCCSDQSSGRPWPQARGEFDQQQPALPTAWQRKGRGGALAPAAAAARQQDTGEPYAAVASDAELADVLLCAVQQAACDSRSAVTREAALSCLAAMLSCHGRSRLAATHQQWDAAAAAAAAPDDASSRLLQSLHSAAAASEWNVVLLEEALARVQAAYLAPDSCLQQLYLQRYCSSAPSSTIQQQRYLPGSAGSSMEACSAGTRLGGADLAKVSAGQAEAALPVAADLLFVAALLGGAASSQQAGVRAQLAKSLDQGQLLAVVGRAACLPADLALHAALRQLLGQGLLDAHASRLLDVTRSLQEQQQDEESWRNDLSLQRMLQQQGSGPPGAAALPQRFKLPAVQAALAHRLLEVVGGLRVGLLPAVVHHSMVGCRGLLGLTLDPSGRSAQAVELLVQQAARGSGTPLSSWQG